MTGNRALVCHTAVLITLRLHHIPRLIECCRHAAQFSKRQQLQAEAVPLLSIPSPHIAVASASSDSSNTLEGSQVRITGRRGHQPIWNRSLCCAAEKEREFQIYDSDMQQYHDDTWGRPETDESRLFESQTLQLMQCGHFIAGIPRGGSVSIFGAPSRTTTWSKLRVSMRRI